MRHDWWLFVAGVGIIAFGLAVWETTFILVPVGVVLIGVGIAKSVKRARA